MQELVGIGFFAGIGIALAFATMFCAGFVFVAVATVIKDRYAAWRRERDDRLWKAHLAKTFRRNG